MNVTSESDFDFFKWPGLLGQWSGYRTTLPLTVELVLKVL